MDFVTLLPFLNSLPYEKTIQEYLELLNLFGYVLKPEDILLTNENTVIKVYSFNEFSTDEGTIGGDYFFFYGKIPFAMFNKTNQGYSNYKIFNPKIFHQILGLLLSRDALKEKNKEVFNYPLCQPFKYYYQVYGENLLYLDNNNDFHKIENCIELKDQFLFSTKTIQIYGQKIQVDYNRIYSVINDNLIIAKELVNKEINYLKYINQDGKVNEEVSV